MKAIIYFSALALLSAYTTAWSSDASVAILPRENGQRTVVAEGYFQIGQPIVFQTAGGSSGVGVLTSYALTDPTGKIIQVAAIPSFLSDALTPGDYRIYAVTYTDDNTIEHLAADGTSLITEVTASCLAVSAPLTVHVLDCQPVCVPVVAHKIR